jgi:hypothetical protein
MSHGTFPVTFSKIAAAASHDLVVVRLGHYRGASYAAPGFSKALALLVEAVSKTQKARPPEFDN